MFWNIYNRAHSIPKQLLSRGKRKTWGIFSGIPASFDFRNKITELYVSSIFSLIMQSSISDRVVLLIKKKIYSLNNVQCDCNEINSSLVRYKKVPMLSFFESNQYATISLCPAPKEIKAMLIVNFISLISKFKQISTYKFNLNLKTPFSRVKVLPFLWIWLDIQKVLANCNTPPNNIRKTPNWRIALCL